MQVLQTQRAFLYQTSEVDSQTDSYLIFNESYIFCKIILDCPKDHFMMDQLVDLNVFGAMV